jgi:hypothetical protein
MHALLLIVLLLKVTATALVLLVAVATVVKARPRWEAIGVALWALFVCRWFFLASTTKPSLAGAEYTAYICFAVLIIRRQFGIANNERADEQNRKLIGTLFGHGAARRYSASIDRMRERSKKAKERGVSVVDILKEERMPEKRSS